MVKVNQGSSYENIDSTRIPDAVYQVSRSSATWFRRRRFVFHHIWAWSYDLEHYPLFLPFSHAKSIRGQIWPCRKIGQGQPRVIIWTNLVVLEYPMLHTNFQGHQLFGSREEDFLKVFTIHGHGGHIGHVTWTIWKLSFPIPWRLHMKFGFNRPSGF